MARISLRLPASVKAKVDQMADREQISTNAWLLRAVMDALGDRRPDLTDGPHRRNRPARRSSAAHGPFGPHGVFGEHGPFGPEGCSGGRNQPERPEHRRPRGRVQGWVR